MQSEYAFMIFKELSIKSDYDWKILKNMKWKNHWAQYIRIWAVSKLQLVFPVELHPRNTYADDSAGSLISQWMRSGEDLIVIDNSHYNLSRVTTLPLDGVREIYVDRWIFLLFFDPAGFLQNPAG